jgi:hypothetical protein
MAYSCSLGKGCSLAAGCSPGGVAGVLAEQVAVLASCSSYRCSPNTALVASRRCSPSAVPPLGHRQASCVAPDLRKDEPSFVHAARRYCVGKRILQVFQMFQRCVTNVLHRCCKSRSGCCTFAMAIHGCFKCRIQMFHLFQTYIVCVYI